MTRWMARSALATLVGLLGLYACGGSSGVEDGSTSGGAGTGSGSGGTGSNGSGDGSGASGTSDGDGAGDGAGTNAPTIPGGGVNAGPLQPGCGPETAQQCIAPGGGCNSDALLDGVVEVKDAGSVCFFGEGRETPSATVEHITEVNAGEEYVHLRVIFDPDFVDTAYGECAAETGWNPNRKGGGHTMKDLVGSDHVELMLYDCAGDLSMHFKVDFIDDKQDTACGFATAGVTDGEGKMIVGDAEHVLAVGTSLDRNMNGCGYCEDTNSPCPGGEGYQPSPEAPEWDFRMAYELWISAEAFGDAGFCTPDIEYVHASPAKESNDTILVEPDECPPPDEPPPDEPPPDEECPFDYELYLASEGEYYCAGPPTNGECPTGYVLDLESEGELCIPEEQQ